ncbi:MAG: PDZ domain-containing protein [Deltaproteobacteria bacterium]|nr:MAG: PDZ domain-containing protein [Deltaproteobacteria bacterium]
MFAIVRPLAVFGAASSMSLLAFHYTGGAVGGELTNFTGGIEAFALGRGYSLAELEILESTLYYVEESYVEPERVDWEAMYDAALLAVERRVPAAMFRREPGGSMLFVEVGDHRAVIEVNPIGSRSELHDALAEVASVLAEELDPTEIPRDDDALGEPLAEVEYALVNGVLSTLDPHSALLPPKASKEMDTENEGKFGGLGITIILREGKLTVEYPLHDTPAMEAGLQPDDHIARIDGESTINMSLDEAVSRLRGRVGSDVVLEIERDGLTEPFDVTVTRAEIRLNPVKSAMLDGDVGYVQVTAFHADVAAQLREELGKLQRKANGRSLKGLVIDLRGNPGGYLTQAIEMSDLFLDSGDIVSTVEADGRKRDNSRARSHGTQDDYPIAVLVNANSASASEIVSGALRNNDRAVVIGERTFGKGSVQNLHPFADDSKLKLTIAKYLTPGDKSIQSVGIPADIALIPVIAEKREIEGEEEPNVAVFWRERVRREADLDKHLNYADLVFGEPAYSLTYHWQKKGRAKSDALDLSSDFEVQFAKDVLLNAPSSHRAEVLKSAATVVRTHQRKAESELAKSLSELGVDWSTGEAVDEASLDVKVSIGDEGKLRAGELDHIEVSVTNTGDKPLYRLAAVSNSEHELLGGLEFVFGKLAPGETRTWKQPVSVADGYPSETAPLSLEFRDVGGKSVASAKKSIEVQGRALPRLRWQWTLSDAAGGDGDGVAEVGEVIDVSLRLLNDGEGETGDAYARIRNKSGRALDIRSGTLEPGEMRTDAGEACPVEQPGVEGGRVVGDPESERVKEGKRPVYQSGCDRSLRPGDEWTGTMQVEIREAGAAPLELELSIGDGSAYDHASIVRAGFYGYFGQTETIEIPVGTPLTSSPEREPPRVEITQKAPELLDVSTVSVSGFVSDDAGLSHVMVFHNDDKIFYEGGAGANGLTRLPFTVDVALEEGMNTITVLAKDSDGLTATRSEMTFYEPPAKAAAAPAEDNKKEE